VNKVGFDNKLYTKLQSENITNRLQKFSKLYVEFGGKLFDDNHASRVLPGFEPDSKIKMLLNIKEQVEIMFVINANDIEKNKKRSDLGITYVQDLMRLIDAFRGYELFVGSVIITHYNKQEEATKLKKALLKEGIKVAYHYTIDNYPSDIEKILSKDGFGKNEYIETTKKIVVVTAPGPGSGKLATCLSQMYHDNLNGIKAGYAKFETFPIWNLPLNHPVNLAYEAATVDLNDVNMIDPFHLDSYNEIAINYNRDVEAFPILNELLIKIMGKQIYHSPTDMGVNMAGYCISDDNACKQASKDEVIRRYYDALVSAYKDESNQNQVDELEIIMKKLNISISNRKCAIKAQEIADKTKEPACAIELLDGRIITGKTSKLMGCASAALLNALKELANVPDVDIIDENVLKPIQKLKVECLKGNNPRLHTDEVLIALAISSETNELCNKAISAFSKLKGCEVHSTVILSEVDINTFKKLGLRLTQSPVYQVKKLYHKS